ncbi:hypothetical protein FRC14_008274 [Serendipita sp. 396]|nr:hypothetical protein FRC14_008274 [Serendipita sp. 396]KAG8819684.1 hypothetical protein FRC18_011952 [Serendipita sp. 400]KAG8848930.1 hypothetical protein FRB91_010371 [Serendipita sp. 411]
MGLAWPSQIVYPAVHSWLQQPRNRKNIAVFSYDNKVYSHFNALLNIGIHSIDRRSSIAGVETETLGTEARSWPNNDDAIVALGLGEDD